MIFWSSRTSPCTQSLALKKGTAYNSVTVSCAVNTAFIDSSGRIRLHIKSTMAASWEPGSGRWQAKSNWCGVMGKRCTRRIQEYVSDYIWESALSEIILGTCNFAENKLPQESELWALYENVWESLKLFPNNMTQQEHCWWYWPFRLTITWRRGPFKFQVCPQSTCQDAVSA